jgi:toxin ParE1/3/4
MANFEIIVQPLAELDFDEIWFSIAQSNTKIADNFVDRIKQKLDILASFPESGPARPDIQPNCRILVVGHYVIF